MYIYVETYIVLLCLKCMKQMQKVHIVDYRKDSYEKKKKICTRKWKNLRY